MPLVNVPMINYTLAWLESAGVEEVFVFCCAHSKQVIDYLENSEWFSQPNFAVQTIESHNSISAGDALRLIYERNVVRNGHFISVGLKGLIIFVSLYNATYNMIFFLQ